MINLQLNFKSKFKMHALVELRTMKNESNLYTDNQV